MLFIENFLQQIIFAEFQSEAYLLVRFAEFLPVVFTVLAEVSVLAAALIAAAFLHFSE